MADPTDAGAAAPRLRRILVPLDGSRLAQGILGQLDPLLRQDTEVHLLRVSDTDGKDEQLPQLPAVEAAMRAQLAKVRAGLDPALRATAELVRGDAATEIVRVAGEGHDLVAMSTHGRTGVDRALRGSVAERVLRTCPVPLLLCNPSGLARPAGPRALRRILVPLDGSPSADRILPLVRELARGAVATVTLLRVEPLTLTDVALADGVPAVPAAGEGLAAQRDWLAAAGVDVEVAAAVGVVPLQILRFAEETDLLAMTTHGRSGPSRWWFGSVAEQVLRHARCPLLIVRST